MSVPAVLRDIGTCVAFFTLLPVPFAWQAPERFAAALWAAPLAGLVVALPVGGALILLVALGLPPGPAAALALGAGMLLTGALHEDGLADVADGFGGGRDVEAKLAIMKDSRNGTFGTLALCLGALLRWSALASLATSPLALPALVAAHMASRALFAPFTAWIAPARGSGLSAHLKGAGRSGVLASLALGLAALLFGGVVFALAAACLLAIWFAVLGRLARVQIGGHTGDVLGTLQQGGEIVVLLLAAALLA